jgi:hypothetical protein
MLLGVGAIGCDGGVCVILDEESNEYVAIYRSDLQETALRMFGGERPKLATHVSNHRFDDYAEQLLMMVILDLDKHMHDDRKLAHYHGYAAVGVLNVSYDISPNMDIKAMRDFKKKHFKNNTFVIVQIEGDKFLYVDGYDHSMKGVNYWRDILHNKVREHLQISDDQILGSFDTALGGNSRKVGRNEEWKQFRRHAVYRTFAGQHERKGKISGVKSQLTATRIALFLHEFVASIEGLKWEQPREQAWLKLIDTVTDPVELANMMLDVQHQSLRITEYHNYACFHADVSQVVGKLQDDAAKLQEMLKKDGRVKEVSGAGQIAAGCLGVVSILLVPETAGASLALAGMGASLCFGLASATVGMSTTVGKWACDKEEAIEKLHEMITEDEDCKKFHHVMREMQTISFACQFSKFASVATKDFAASAEGMKMHKEVHSELQERFEKLKKWNDYEQTVGDLIQGTTKQVKFTTGLVRFYKMCNMMKLEGESLEEIQQINSCLLDFVKVTSWPAVNLSDIAGKVMGFSPESDAPAGVFAAAGKIRACYNDGTALADGSKELLGKLYTCCKATKQSGQEMIEAMTDDVKVEKGVQIADSFADVDEGSKAAKDLNLIDQVKNGVTAVKNEVTAANEVGQVGSKIAAGLGIVGALVDFGLAAKDIWEGHGEVTSHTDEYVQSAKNLAQTLDEQATSLKDFWPL